MPGIAAAQHASATTRKKILVTRAAPMEN